MYSDQTRMKKCKKCLQTKDLIEFHKDAILKDGFRNICKVCAIRVSILNQKNNAKRRSLYMKAYSENNKEKLTALRRRYYVLTKETSRKDYLAKTLEYRRKYNNLYEKRKDKDPIWRLRRSLRTRLNRAILGEYRKGSAVSDLGCTIEFFKSYIESKFDSRMTWGNWGRYTWHLDHIIPLNNFNLKKRSELKKAVHYTNFQPLWWNDNLSKGKIV